MWTGRDLTSVLRCPQKLAQIWTFLPNLGISQISSPIPKARLQSENEGTHTHGAMNLNGYGLLPHNRIVCNHVCLAQQQCLNICLRGSTTSLKHIEKTMKPFYKQMAGKWWTKKTTGKKPASETSYSDKPLMQTMVTSHANKPMKQETVASH